VTPSGRVAGDLAAVEIVRLARERPGELSLVAVGPLTNIGLALLLEPRLPELVRQVVVMGGAVGVPGNASELGEANVWHDPEAAALVVDAPWDVLFVGLEITMSTPLPLAAIERIAATRHPVGRLAWRIMQHYLDVYEKVLGERSCVLHDPLAMALALDPALATYRTVNAYVDTGTSRSRGAIVGDLRASGTGADPAVPGTIRIVDTLDTAAFHERFLQALGA
jgi:purine nucleosidase